MHVRLVSDAHARLRESRLLLRQVASGAAGCMTWPWQCRQLLLSHDTPASRRIYRLYETLMVVRGMSGVSS